MADYKNLTKAQVRKYLANMDVKELQDMILTLYDCGTEAKARVNSIIQGKGFVDSLYEKYETRMKNALESTDFSNASTKAAIAKAKREVAEFKKMTGDDEKAMLLNADCAYEAVLQQDGMWSFNEGVFNVIRPVVKKVTEYAAKHKHFYEEVKDKLFEMQEIFEQYVFLWWEVKELYEKIPWYFEDFPEEEDEQVEQKTEESSDAPAEELNK